MRRIAYVMHFRGRISPVASELSSLRATASATSCTVTTTVNSSGLEADVKSCHGGLAFLDSELHVSGADLFHEDGTISFGDDTEHVLRFSTIGHGRLASTLAPGTMAGTSSSSIQGGEGQFAAASGFITSMFTLTDAGELEEFHNGLIFLPEPRVAVRVNGQLH